MEPFPLDPSHHHGYRQPYCNAGEKRADEERPTSSGKQEEIFLPGEWKADIAVYMDLAQVAAAAAAASFVLVIFLLFIVYHHEQYRLKPNFTKYPFVFSHDSHVP